MQKQATRLKNLTPTKLVAFGVGSAVDVNELNDIASDPDNDNVIQATNFNSLGQWEDEVLDVSCPDSVGN